MIDGTKRICIDCGTLIVRNGEKGRHPIRCPACAKEASKARARHKYWNDPKWRKKRLMAWRKRYHTDSDFRDKQLKYHSDRYHNDPEFREAKLKYCREYMRDRYCDQKEAAILHRHNSIPMSVRDEMEHRIGRKPRRGDLFRIHEEGWFELHIPRYSDIWLHVSVVASILRSVSVRVTGAALLGKFGSLVGWTLHLVVRAKAEVSMVWSRSQNGATLRFPKRPKPFHRDLVHRCRAWRWLRFRYARSFRPTVNLFLPKSLSKSRRALKGLYRKDNNILGRRSDAASNGD